VAAPYRQRIPRPAAARRIGPPAWARAPVGWSHVANLAGQLPGDGSWRVDAAVLVPVYAQGDEPVLVLIRRSGLLARDPGHVAFPGGRIEAGETPLEAALREAHEEVGLDRATVVATGSLGVYGRREQRVAAFLAVLGGQPTLAPDHVEVEAVLLAPLNALLAEGACWEERWEGVPMYFFAPEPGAGETPGDLVWGLTARILWELSARLAGGPAGAHGAGGTAAGRRAGEPQAGAHIPIGRNSAVPPLA
jgi:8-oxo-dGTP pyrophosphatase MutT (NUDIX family)